ncbi:MAG: tRNA epoxyqueuosine(34) reductase QueG [Chromatiales bacterium]|nr:tRNA epoxyqueuosine(34) reductase QueG [Chromatiales bacterium]
MACAPRIEPERLVRDIRGWADELGFDGVGITGCELADDERRLLAWLAADHHGEMDYMARHGVRRSRPAELVPGTVSVISVRVQYWPESAAAPWSVLGDPERGYIARYALGRDYHKVLRGRLQRLADRIEAAVGPFGYRAFTDSAPVLEKPLARNAGLGWVGKHTNLIDARSGSWFFLGELYTDLALPADPPHAQDHCGRCRACIDACPTGAIVAPYQLDARRCISYLTIELRGAIPVELRASIGNRIFGCDDCQLVCPWNRFARSARLPDLAPRGGLDAPALTDLMAWDEAEFDARTRGSALRRVGHTGWLRNVAVALGNAPPSTAAREALAARADHHSAMVREHVAWALARQRARSAAPESSEVRVGPESAKLPRPTETGDPQ